MISAKEFFMICGLTIVGLIAVSGCVYLVFHTFASMG